jgi:hypothetical protein
MHIVQVLSKSYREDRVWGDRKIFLDKAALKSCILFWSAFLCFDELISLFLRSEIVICIYKKIKGKINILLRHTLIKDEIKANVIIND